VNWLALPANLTSSHRSKLVKEPGLPPGFCTIVMIKRWDD
jgi:hypothetical protein